MLSALARLSYLAEAAKYDVCLASCNQNQKGKQGRSVDPEDPSRWIFPVAVPGKGMVSMLKVLQSNICKNHCRYCAFSSDNDQLRRVRLLPEELAKLFMQFVHKEQVHGLFLSTGISDNTDRSMVDVLKTAELLRFKYRFNGYIHLKILPGCSEHLMEAALMLANRISLNLESATVNGLARVAPEKELKQDLIRPLHWTGQRLGRGNTRTVSQTTQFVVGPSEEKDSDILKAVDWVYRDLHVFRSYYSAYQQPFPDAPPAEPWALLREHRLYQSDFLLRAYGFRLPDLIFDGSGNLPLHVDPKKAFAMKNPQLYPVEINTASVDLLLKVPGIGPGGAQKIIERRKESPIRDKRTLRNLGILYRRAEPWILMDGKRPGEGSVRQREWLELNPDIADSAKEQWLFPEMTPENWTSGLQPLGRKNLNTSYSYPAQQGKRVNYPMNGSAPVPCR